MAIHQADPEYFTSRIPRTWGYCSNYTCIVGGSESGPPVYSTSDLASKATHFRVEYFSPEIDNR